VRTVVEVEARAVEQSEPLEVWTQAAEALHVDGERVLTGHVDDRHPLSSEIGCPELCEHRLAGRCGTEQPGDRALWQVRLEDPPSTGDPLGDQLREIDRLKGEPFLGALRQRGTSCGSDESLAAGHLVPSHNRTSPL
jgi:hypothetical protein